MGYYRSCGYPPSHPLLNKLIRAQTEQVHESCGHGVGGITAATCYGTFMVSTLGAHLCFIALWVPYIVLLSIGPGVGSDHAPDAAPFAPVCDDDCQHDKYRAIQEGKQATNQAKQYWFKVIKATPMVTGVAWLLGNVVIKAHGYCF